MEGIIKLKVSEQQLNHALQLVYGCKAISMTELTDGWANSAYDVLMEDGQTYIVKVSPSLATKLMRYEYRLMKTEVDVLNLLQQVSSIPVPKVIKYDRTRKFVDGEFFIMEKLPGQPYNKLKNQLTAEERHSIEIELGRYNKLINEIKGSNFGFYSASNQDQLSWRDTFLFMINGVLDDGEDAQLPLPIAYDELRQILNNRSHCMNEVETPSLVHWDLWDGNVFVENDRITGIIDFERALWGDPLIEHYFSNKVDSSSFVEGYDYYRILSDSERKRLAYYNLYLDLILYIECHFRGYTNNEHISWAKTNVAEGITAFLEQSK